MGKSDPIASNEDEVGRSHNRRVDFIFSTAAPHSTAAGN
jgi:outer membrane protein OmpA-like peptidoglycan-associated protein